MARDGRLGTPGTARRPAEDCRDIAGAMRQGLAPAFGVPIAILATRRRRELPPPIVPGSTAPPERAA